MSDVFFDSNDGVLPINRISLLCEGGKAKFLFDPKKNQPVAYFFEASITWMKGI